MASFSDALTVLSPPGGAHGVGEGIFGFLTTREARPLRLVSRVLCADVRNARWYDRDTVITGDLRKWRACFSDARCANVSERRDLVDADLVHLSGVEEVNLSGCTQITDAGLAHLRGVRVLNIVGCTQITDAGLAHLTGIHTLLMHGCDRTTVAAARALGFSVEYDEEEEEEEVEEEEEEEEEGEDDDDNDDDNESEDGEG